MRICYIAAFAFTIASQGLAQESRPAVPPAQSDERIQRLIRMRDEARASQSRDRAAAQARDRMDRGAKYLIASQAADGSWEGEKGPGITALAVWALVQAPGVGPDHPAVKKGFEFLFKSQRDDGGVYGAEGQLKNYESSVALSALAAARRPEDQKKIEALQKFLIGNQWAENTNTSVDNPAYGGAGYGRSARPDLSNTQIMLEALHDSGLPPDHPAYQKALVFITRCQMLGEKNDQAFAKGSTQGGFIYTPVGGGESKAETIDVNGRQELRSYGSMTYAGFKSLLFAGLSKDDPRIKAAREWISRHWTLDYNPNMPEKQSREGVYYYYHVFARALKANGEDTLNDAQGNARDWRVELLEKLAALQRSDGSWVNEADRWYEGMPALTTAYSLLALEAAFGTESNQQPKP